MPTLVRAASLTHFAQVAAQCGLDARALVIEAGLPLRCLDEPDLKVSTRAVARLLELAAEGTSFSQLTDELRRDLLSRYTEDGERGLAEVSQLLGFSSPSAFSRWHRAAFGCAARDRSRQVG